MAKKKGQSSNTKESQNLSDNEHNTLLKKLITLYVNFTFSFHLDSAKIKVKKKGGKAKEILLFNLERDLVL